MTAGVNPVVRAAPRVRRSAPHRAARDGGLALVAVNETAEAWVASAAVTRFTLTGEPRAKTSVDLDVPAYSSVVLALPADLARPEDARCEVLVAEAGGTAERALWFFAEDRDMEWPAAAWDATVEPVEGGQRVRVTAHTVLRDLTLFPDRLDPTASVDTALVTLLPGESAILTVRVDAPLDDRALTTRPVLRCVNDI
ncbi:hypothetical protein NKG94_26420 [Micromonospora sp. M12]